MRWLLAVVVLVLAVVLGATLWKSSPRDDPNSAPTSQPAPETAPGSAPAEPARVAIPSALSARSVPYASAVAAAPAAPRIRVVALVRATGQPCAGAEVWYPVDAKAAFSGLDA